MGEIKIISYNVNGIRSAMNKGFADWLKQAAPDVICLQEMKVHKDDFDAKPFEALGYHCYMFDAAKKGYSGVGIFSKIKPDHIEVGMGLKQYDDEGRMLRIDIGDLSILSVYFPSGTTGDERQAVKMKFLDDVFNYLHKLSKKRTKLVVTGDYNIANHPIDIHNPVANKDTSGFIDTFRYFHKNAAHEYSWWSFRANSRNNNKGWRIDYIAVTKNLEKNLVEASIMQNAMHSDHAPVYLKLKV